MQNKTVTQSQTAVDRVKARNRARLLGLQMARGAAPRNFSLATPEDIMAFSDGFWLGLRRQRILKG